MSTMLQKFAAEARRRVTNNPERNGDVIYGLNDEELRLSELEGLLAENATLEERYRAAVADLATAAAGTKELRAELASYAPGVGTCNWCGQRSIPISLARQHMMTCVKHPLGTALAELAASQAEVAAHQERYAALVEQSLRDVAEAREEQREATLLSLEDLASCNETYRVDDVMETVRATPLGATPLRDELAEVRALSLATTGQSTAEAVEYLVCERNGAKADALAQSHAKDRAESERDALKARLAQLMTLDAARDVELRGLRVKFLDAGRARDQFAIDSEDNANEAIRARVERDAARADAERYRKAAEGMRDALATVAIDLSAPVTEAGLNEARAVAHRILALPAPDAEMKPRCCLDSASNRAAGLLKEKP